MHITRLAVKNWACHRAKTISFKPGVNGILGLNGCVDKDTLLFDPVTRTSEAISKITQPFHVLARNSSGQIVVAKASRPFIKGVEDMFEVTTAQGSITATLRHRFLTADGWKTLSELSVGAYLISYSHALTSPSLAQSAHDADDRHCRRITPGSADRYSECSRPCGEQPLSGLGTAQGASPSQAGALQHMSPHEHGGGLDDKLEHSRPGQLCAHLSTSDSARNQPVGPTAEWGCHACELDDADSSLHSPGSHTPPRASALEKLLERTVRPLGCLSYFACVHTDASCSGLPEGQGHAFLAEPATQTLAVCAQTPSGKFEGSGQLPVQAQGPGVFYSACTSPFVVTPILAVNPVGSRVVWDVTVEEHANYLAQGFVNHNSGKSALMDALRFGITGATVAAGANNDNITVGEKAAAIIVDFHHGGVDYSVKRALPSPAPFMKYQDKTVTGVAGIGTKIEEILGTSIDTLLQNVFIGQHAIDDILFKTQSERLKEFQETCGLSAAAEAYKVLGAELSQYKVTQGLQGQLDAAVQLLESTKAELAGYVSQLATLSEEVSTCEDHSRKISLYNELRKQLERHSELVAKLQATRIIASTEEASLRKSEASLLRVQGLVESHTEKAKASELRLQELQIAKAKSLHIEGELARLAHVELIVIPAELPTEIDNVSSKLAKLRAIESGEAPLPRLPGDEEVEQTLAALTSRLVDLKSEDPEVAVLTSEVKHLISHKKTFASGACPTCHRSIDNFDPHKIDSDIQAKQAIVLRLQTERSTTISQVKSQIESSKTLLEKHKLIGLASVSKNIQVLQKTKEDLTSTLQLLVNSKAQAEASLKRRTELSAELSSIPVVDPSEVSMLESTLQTFRKAEKDLQELKHSCELHKQARDTAVETLSELERILSGLPSAESLPPPDLVALWTSSAQKLSTKTLSQRQLESRIGVHEAKIEHFRVTVEQLVRQRDNEAHIVKWVNLCAKARDLLHVSGLPTLLMREFAHKLNRRMTYYLDMWNSPFRVYLDDNLSFMAQFPSGATYAAARLSGGQKIVASTSFRLAMSDTFARNVGLLILDEPSNHLDKDNIIHLQQLLVKLKQLAGQSGRQILIVTHEESLIGFFDHTINLGIP